MFQVFFIGFTTGCLVGFAMEFIFKRKQNAGTTDLVATFDDEMPSRLPNDGNTFKLALLVNTGLKMGDGKIVAQCAHAVVGSYEMYYKTRRSNFNTWELQGRQISVYKISDTETIQALYRTADDIDLMPCLIRDAGRTQIAAGSTTVLALGPEEEELLSPIVEHLVSY